MRDLRVDLFSGDVIIFAPDRTGRPTDMKKIEDEKELANIYEEKCPFCRGNEELSAGTTFQIKGDSGWICKSIYNKYPIIEEGAIGISGIHEVIIDTYRHNGSFYNMSEIEFKNMFLAYQNRYKEYIENKDTVYISIFKNFLKKAGASLAHPHSQIISMSLVPKYIKNEVEVLKEYYESKKESLYEKVINEEISLNERVVYNGEKFLVLIPYASMYNNEVRIICKDSSKFENLSEVNLNELSYIFKKVFEKIYIECGYMPFNLCMHAHPKGLENDNLFHLHFHVIPRKYNFGGFEVSNGIYVSSTKPQDFAKKIKFK